MIAATLAGLGVGRVEHAEIPVVAEVRHVPEPLDDTALVVDRDQRVDEVGVARDLLEALVDRAGLLAGRHVLDEDDAAGPQVAQGRPGLLGGAPDPGEQQQLADPVLVGGQAAHRLGDGLLLRRGRGAGEPAVAGDGPARLAGAGEVPGGCACPDAEGARCRR